MKEILEQAEELGKAIAASERAEGVEAARREVESDASLQSEMKQLGDLSERIAALEKEVKPVEPADKRRRRDLQESISRHPKMRQLARAEADFAELMNRVNRAIREQFMIRGNAEADAP